MPRNAKLELEISRIKTAARFVGKKIFADNKFNEDSYILSNEEADRAVLIGAVEFNSTNILSAFIINVPKYKWAEAEGFSKIQVLDELASEIFTFIEVKKVAPYLLKSDK